MNERVFKTSLSSFISFLAIAIITIAVPDHVSEVYVSELWFRAMVILAVLLFVIPGLYLWVKGFSWYASKLKNPWLFALYVGLSAGAGLVMYALHRNENNS